MIDARTETCCIFGNPVRHSLSPLMHNAAFRETGINAVYVAFEPEDISAALDAMRSLEFMGASITIPFKIDVIPHLDDIDPLAAAIGSVNTLVNRDGRLKGYNTDGIGAVTALRNAGMTVTGSRALVLGNGGSARAIAFTLKNEGCAVSIAGRNRERVRALCDDLELRDSDALDIFRLNAEKTKAFDVIINTTPIGMTPETEESPLPVQYISPASTVFDIIYNPHETLLLRQARERGCPVVHGIDMLLYQGVRQFELWTGKEAPAAIMRDVLERNLS